VGCGMFLSDGRLGGKGGVRDGWRGEQEGSGRGRQEVKGAWACADGPAKSGRREGKADHPLRERHQDEPQVQGGVPPKGR
jgi:hypothetical protein